MGDAENVKVFPVKLEETKSQPFGHHLDDDTPRPGAHIRDSASGSVSS